MVMIPHPRNAHKQVMGRTRLYLAFVRRQLARGGVLGAVELAHVRPPNEVGVLEGLYVYFGLGRGPQSTTTLCGMGINCLRTYLLGPDARVRVPAEEAGQKVERPGVVEPAT